MNDKTFHLSLVTPASECLSEPARLVEVPAQDGDMGVLAGHAPMITMIRPGVVTIHSEKTIEKWFITAGYIDITPERCSILAESATPLSELSKKDATTRKEAAEAALSKAKTDIETAHAEQALREADALMDALAA